MQGLTFQKSKVDHKFKMWYDSKDDYSNKWETVMYNLYPCISNMYSYVNWRSMNLCAIWQLSESVTSVTVAGTVGLSAIDIWWVPSREKWDLKMHDLWC